MIEFKFKPHCNLLPGVYYEFILSITTEISLKHVSDDLINVTIGSGNGLVLADQTITWINAAQDLGCLIMSQTRTIKIILFHKAIIS